MKHFAIFHPALALSLALIVPAAAAAQHLHPDASTPQNCGPVGCLMFNRKEQLIDTHGIHAFKAPKHGDHRGPCPGLNAAANHGYLPHSGLVTIEQAIVGLEQMYAMSPDLSGLLAAYAVAMDGDVLTQTFSIGGPFVGTFGSQHPQGLSYSHNRFESDASIARSDAYMNHGDAFSLNLTKFEHLYSLGVYTEFRDIPQIDFDIEMMRRQFKYSQDESIANNPYYFSAPFSGAIAIPAAHNFIINLFSKHTVARPNGYLDTLTLRRFFGLTGDPRGVADTVNGTEGVKTPFKVHQFHERVPANWTRRPLVASYTFADLVNDIADDYRADPSTLRIGGNTGRPNSFVGVSVSELTGGTYDETSLLKGRNLGCFALQAMQAALPDTLTGLLGDTRPALDLVNGHVAPLLLELGCPALKQYNQGLFDKFPGYRYAPKGKVSRRKVL